MVLCKRLFDFYFEFFKSIVFTLCFRNELVELIFVKDLFLKSFLGKYISNDP